MARTAKRARKSSPLNLPGAFELWKPSKELVLKNIWIFGPLYAVTLIFYIHSWLWSPLPHQTVNWWQHADKFSSGWAGVPVPTYLTFTAVGLSFLWLFLIVVVGTVTQVMIQAAQLNAAQDKPVDFNDLGATAKKMTWNMFKLYIVSGLAIVLTLFIFTRRYYLASFVMLDKKTGVLESMRESDRISRINPGSVWRVVGVVVLIGFLNVIPIVGGLLAFAVGMLYSVAPALRYQQLKKLSAQ